MTPVLAAVNYVEPWWVQIIKALLIFGVIFALLPILIIYERKLLGRFQNRYGPNRVGPFGLLQPIAEILKFATKEALRRLQRRLSREEGEDLILLCYTSQDFREGMDAFLNKRKPVWKGR